MNMRDLILRTDKSTTNHFRRRTDQQEILPSQKNTTTFLNSVFTITNFQLIMPSKKKFNQTKSILSYEKIQ